MSSLLHKNPTDERSALNARETALQLLLETDARQKALGVLNFPWAQAIEQALPGDLCRTLTFTQSQTLSLPGRPSEPEWVAPSKVPRRGLHNREGHAALIHALAHIEFNAINLALDIFWRFPSQPIEFYLQWAQVAHDEARHHLLLSDHLESLGFKYGDFLAHGSLWEMAEKTADCLLARLALVPRTLEARGLDASPAVRDKLRQFGDLRGAEIVQTILDDEIGHVAVGNRWFRHECALRGLNPEVTYRELAKQYEAPRLQPPFNVAGRLEAGFTQAELIDLGVLQSPTQKTN